MSNIPEAPRERLKEIIAKNGDGLLQDPDRCEGLLKDHCGPHRREISVLVGALEERIPLELKSSWQSAMTPEAMRARLVQRLQDNRGLAPEVADWAVDAWSYALGVGLGRRSARLDSIIITGGVPLIAPVADPAAPNPSVQSQPQAPGFALGGASRLSQQLHSSSMWLTRGWSKQKQIGVAAGVVALGLIIYLTAPSTQTRSAQPCPAGQTRSVKGTCEAPPATDPVASPTPSAPKPKIPFSIALGTYISVKVSQNLNSDKLTAGQYVNGTVNSDLKVHGKKVVPAGASVVFQVKDLDQAGTSAKIDLVLVEISFGGKKYPVVSDEFVVKGPKASTNKKSGAIDKPKPAELKSGTTFRLKLTQPLTM